MGLPFDEATYDSKKADELTEMLFIELTNKVYK